MMRKVNAALYFFLLSLSLLSLNFGLKLNKAHKSLIPSNLLSKAALLSSALLISGGQASIAAEWTDRNRLAAETWRAVDDLYIDRTFNGKDWFKLRQSVVKKDYKSDEEVYKSLQDMLSNLGDKYTRYLTPAQYSALVNSATGNLVGLGVELQTSEDGKQTVVARVEEGSPAQEAGLQKDDIIVNVDGTDTVGISPEEVAAIMRGKLDTKASVRVSRGGQILDLSALRKPIKLVGVGAKTLTAGEKTKKKVGFISVRAFSASTRDEVMRALEDFHSKSDVDVIVMDLRNNGGGLLQGAVETSNLFMNPGKIVTFVVTKEGRVEAQQTIPGGVPSADPDLPDTRRPFFILVNSNTASAAEVFAAAMKENGRATIVGEQTFGKGIIQNLQELRQGGIAVTTARYETPLHNNINKIGIKVDIPVDCGSSVAIETCLNQFL